MHCIDPCVPRLHFAAGQFVTGTVQVSLSLLLLLLLLCGEIYALLYVDRIGHYEQRLKALYYKKKFNERMSDAKNKVEGGCQTLKRYAE